MGETKCHYSVPFHRIIHTDNPIWSHGLQHRAKEDLWGVGWKEHFIVLHLCCPCSLVLLNSYRTYVESYLTIHFFYTTPIFQWMNLMCKDYYEDWKIQTWHCSLHTSIFEEEEEEKKKKTYMPPTTQWSEFTAQRFHVYSWKLCCAILACPTDTLTVTRMHTEQ